MVAGGFSICPVPTIHPILGSRQSEKCETIHRVFSFWKLLKLDILFYYLNTSSIFGQKSCCFFLFEKVVYSYYFPFILLVSLLLKARRFIFIFKRKHGKNRCFSSGYVNSWVQMYRRLPYALSWLMISKAYCGVVNNK